MRGLHRLLRFLGQDESGATAIEYTLLAALIGAAAILGFDLVGQSLEEVFNSVDNAL
jgi:pilus assembly protein Flp/PilA